MNTNGKVSQFFKSNWRTLLFVVAVFAGIFCGVWACSQSPTLAIDAHRNRIEVELIKAK